MHDDEHHLANVGDADALHQRPRAVLQEHGLERTAQPEVVRQATVEQVNERPLLGIEVRRQLVQLVRLARRQAPFAPRAFDRFDQVRVAAAPGMIGHHDGAQQDRHR